MNDLSPLSPIASGALPSVASRPAIPSAPVMPTDTVQRGGSGVPMVDLRKAAAVVLGMPGSAPEKVWSHT